MDNEKLKVVIYCRVGTESQTLDSQEEQLTLYYKKKGYELYKKYIDNGYSVNENRPAYNLMLEDLKRKHFNMILVYNLNRLERSFYDMLNFMELLNENDCKLKVLNNPTDDMFLDINIAKSIKRIWEKESWGDK